MRPTHPGVAGRVLVPFPWVLLGTCASGEGGPKMAHRALLPRAREG
jgi:hypothetical protein